MRIDGHSLAKATAAAAAAAPAGAAENAGSSDAYRGSLGGTSREAIPGMGAAARRSLGG